MAVIFSLQSYVPWKSVLSKSIFLIYVTPNQFSMFNKKNLFTGRVSGSCFKIKEFYLQPLSYLVKKKTGENSISSFVVNKACSI